jgi:branched-chain amino acid transport system substrate-binding protein
MMKGARMRAALLALLVMVSALAVAACGSSSSSSSSAAASGGGATTSGGGATSSSASSSSASAASNGPATGSPFTYLMVIDTTGPTKAIGVVDQAAMEASVKYWNAHGGIGGHPVKLTVLNDNGDETTAVSQFEQYVSSHPKPDALFPGTSGVDSGGLLPAAKREHILAMGVDDGGAACIKDAQTTCPTTFTPGPIAPNQQAPVGQFFISKGYKTVGILQEQDAFSESETPYLEADLKAAGIKVVTASFSPTAVDLTPEMSQLKSEGAQAVYAEALAAPAGFEAKARAQLGLVNTIPMVFDFGAASLDLTKLVPAADLVNSYEAIAKSSDPYVNMPGRTLLIANGSPVVTSQPIIIASFEWQDLVTLHDAALQAGKTDVDSMTNTLENLAPKYQTDRLNMTSPGVEFTHDIHENMSPLGKKAYEVVPVGPIKNGMVYYKQK